MTKECSNSAAFVILPYWCLQRGAKLRRITVTDLTYSLLKLPSGLRSFLPWEDWTSWVSSLICRYSRYFWVPAFVESVCDCQAAQLFSRVLGDTCCTQWLSEAECHGHSSRRCRKQNQDDPSVWVGGRAVLYFSTRSFGMILENLILATTLLRRAIVYCQNNTIVKIKSNSKKRTSLCSTRHWDLQNVWWPVSWISTVF